MTNGSLRTSGTPRPSVSLNEMTGITMENRCGHLRAAEMADRSIHLHWIDPSNSEGYLQP